MPNNRRIIYIGGFVDEAIVAERGLPSHNAAGSNRMERISCALKSTGYQPVILSPGMSLRARSKGGLLYHARLRRRYGSSVIFAPAFNIPGLNVFSSFFFQFACLRKILNSGRVRGAIIYNFNPSLVLLCAYLKYFHRLPVLNNVEDVSVPSLDDWGHKSEARAMQQIIFSICMKLVARIADGYIVPTRRFLDYLPTGKPSVIVTGCIRPKDFSASDDVTEGDEYLHLLYAGKIAREHGIEQFITALRQLDNLDEPPRVQVDITGAGDMAEWVQEQIGTLSTIRITYHGFVSSPDYARLLHNADICFALQDPAGRYANYKTPSKIYEFLGHGKAVIATDVGDLRDMPQGSVLLLDRLDSGEIADKLLLLCTDKTRTASMQGKALRYAQENFSYLAVGKVLKDLLHSCKGY